MGCGRVGFEPRAAFDASVVDTGDAAVSVCHTGTFSPPVLVAQVLVSQGADWSPSVTADGRVLVYSSDRSGVEEMYTSTFDAASGWSPPAEITELATGTGRDGNPAISPDGLTLVWGQTNGFGGISRATRPTTSATWGSAQQLIADNQAFYNIEGPELSADGQTLYFSAIPGAGAIYSAYMVRLDDLANPRRIVELDDIMNVGWPTVTADELEMFYTGSNAGGANEIRRATRASRTDPWTPRGIVTELDTGASENDAAISFDGSTIYFASDRTTNFELYTATRSCD